MNRSKFIRKLQRNKPFLNRVRQGGKTRSSLYHILKLSQKRQLNLLLEIIHHILNGKVPLKQEVLTRLVKTNKLPFLRSTFENPGNFRKLLDSGSDNKIKTIASTGPALSILLQTFFETRV